MADPYPYLPDDSIVSVQRGPEPGGIKGVYRAFGETLRGLKTTMARVAEGPVTIEYPEEKTPVYPRFRGRHKLHRFEDTGQAAAQSEQPTHFSSPVSSKRWSLWRPRKRG